MQSLEDDTVNPEVTSHPRIRIQYLDTKPCVLLCISACKMKNTPTESKLCWITAGFVPLSTTGIWGWVILGHGGLPRAGKMQSPYPPDDSCMRHPQP